MELSFWDCVAIFYISGVIVMTIRQIHGIISGRIHYFYLKAKNSSPIPVTTPLMNFIFALAMTTIIVSSIIIWPWGIYRYCKTGYKGDIEYKEAVKRTNERKF